MCNRNAYDEAFGKPEEMLIIRYNGPNDRWGMYGHYVVYICKHCKPVVEYMLRTPGVMRP